MGKVLITKSLDSVKYQIDLTPLYSLVTRLLNLISERSITKPEDYHIIIQSTPAGEAIKAVALYPHVTIDVIKKPEKASVLDTTSFFNALDDIKVGLAFLIISGVRILGFRVTPKKLKLIYSGEEVKVKTLIPQFRKYRLKMTPYKERTYGTITDFDIEEYLKPTLNALGIDTLQAIELTKEEYNASVLRRITCVGAINEVWYDFKIILVNRR